LIVTGNQIVGRMERCWLYSQKRRSNEGLEGADLWGGRHRTLHFLELHRSLTL